MILRIQQCGVHSKVIYRFCKYAGYLFLRPVLEGLSIRVVTVHIRIRVAKLLCKSA